MFFKKDSNIGVLFYRPPIWTSLASSFEYIENWPGTINNINYPDTFTGFDSPTASISESFEPASGW